MKKNKKLIKIVNTMELLEVLCKLKCLSVGQFEILKSAYNYYRDYISNINFTYGEFDGNNENLNLIKFPDALLEHFSNVSMVFSDLV